MPPRLSPDPRDCGPQMRRARLAKGLSLRETAARCGTSHAALTRLEHGDLTAVGLGTVQRIARVVGVDEIDAACWYGELPPEVVAYLAERPEIVRGLMERAKATRRRAG